MKKRVVHHHMPPPHPGPAIARRRYSCTLGCFWAATFSQPMSQPSAGHTGEKATYSNFWAKDNFSEHPVSAALLYSSPPPLNIV